jgi:hypothetical protein
MIILDGVGSESLSLLVGFVDGGDSDTHAL